jgi:hypothetical protein
MKGRQHSDVQESQQQQDADIADDEQIHNLPSGHTFAAVAGGHVGRRDTVLALSTAGYGRISDRSSAGVAEWQTRPA